MEMPRPDHMFMLPVGLGIRRVLPRHIIYYYFTYTYDIQKMYCTTLSCRLGGVLHSIPPHRRVPEDIPLHRRLG
jgi:hypothetical protein